MKKTIKKEKVFKNLVVCCGHILTALRKKSKIAMFEVLPETFVCSKCERHEPKNKKEYMKMFNTVCKGCINNNK